MERRPALDSFEKPYQSLVLLLAERVMWKGPTLQPEGYMHHRLARRAASIKVGRQLQTWSWKRLSLGADTSC